MSIVNSVLTIMLLILLIPTFHSLLSKNTTKIIYSLSPQIFTRFNFVQIIGSGVFGRVLDIEYDVVNSKRKYIVELHRPEDTSKTYPYYGRYRILYGDEIVGIENIYGDF